MSGQISWQSSLSSALKLASEQKKMVFMDFVGMTWPACTRMETGTFPQDQVSEYINKYFVPLKYESGRDAEQFLRFEVKATPTFIILNTAGDELHRLIGYYAPDQFLQQIESVRAKISQ